MLSTLLLAGQAAAQLTTGAPSVGACPFPTGMGLENFDAADGYFWGKPASGDIIRMNAQTCAVETMLPYPAATTGLPGVGTALPNAVRFKRGDTCTLYMSFNEAGTGGALVGVGGGLAILNVCTSPIQIVSYTDMTSLGGGAPVAVADAVTMPNGQIAATGLPTGQLFSVDADGSNPVQRVAMGTSCTPNGVESTGTHILASCFRFAGAPLPASPLMRWDPSDDSTAPVVFAGGYVCQADDMHFSPDRSFLVIACGDDGGATTYSDSAIAVTTSDNWATADVVWTSKNSCPGNAAVTFVGNDLYGICFGFEQMFKYELPAALSSCAAWCNPYTCGIDSCSGCATCQTISTGQYCANWCNAYTCNVGGSYCDGCSDCDTLASGGYCASWCNAWTGSATHCGGCTTSWTSLKGQWVQWNTITDNMPAECINTNTGATGIGIYTEIPLACCTARLSQPLLLFDPLFAWNTATYPADTVCRDMTALFGPGSAMLGACDGQGNSYYGEGCSSMDISTKCGCQGIVKGPSQPSCWRVGDFPEGSFPFPTGNVAWAVYHDQCGA